MAKLGFTSIKVLNAEIIADPSITANSVYLINTNYLRLQVLRTPQLKTVGDNPLTLPFTVRETLKDIDTFNAIQLWRLTFNLTAKSLQRQGLVDNVS